MGNVGMPPLLPTYALQPKPKGEPTETFRWLRSHEAKMLEYQFGIARWIMASLLVINGAGLLSLPSVAEKHPAAGGAATWFLIGIIAAVLVGALAWFNCNCITMATGHRTNWDAEDYQSSPQADRWDAAAIVFAWLAVTSVLISLAAFTVGATKVQSAVAEMAAAPPTAPTFTDEQMRALENAGIAKPVPTKQ